MVYKTVTDEDPCASKYCGKGRECHVSAEGTARCVCASHCPHHRERLVCGTDGAVYHSHCELHRAACIQRRSIAVDHAMTCLKRHRKPVIPTPGGFYILLYIYL